MKLKLKIFQSYREIDAGAWDSLIPEHVCTRYAWLCALEESQSMAAHNLRYKIPALIDESGRLLAAAPLVIKPNTVCEYGVEKLWLQKAHDNGIELLPKFQLESPLTAATAPRLLTHPALPREILANVMLQATIDASSASSMNALTIARMTDEEAKLAQQAGLVISYEIGSVWRNEGYKHYGDYIARLKSKPRYDIQHERTQFRQQGLEVRVLRGAEIHAKHWEEFHRGYSMVCKKHNDRVLLNRQFFDKLTGMGDNIILIAAFADNTFQAGVLCLRTKRQLLIRNWAAVVNIPHAVPEITLHQPIELAIELGLDEIDCGVWGAHKSKRGYAPVAHPNAHWFRDPAMHRLASSIAGQHYAAFTASQIPTWHSRYFRST